MNLHPHPPTSVEHDADACSVTLRGWTGEFFQVREPTAGELRLWHPDGSYYGRLVPDEQHREDAASGTVYGPTGLYLADARKGRLRVDPLRRRARAGVDGMGIDEFASPGDLAPVDRRWPRRG